MTVDQFLLFIARLALGVYLMWMNTQVDRETSNIFSMVIAFVLTVFSIVIGVMALVSAALMVLP